jgi:hypothetical protein
LQKGQQSRYSGSLCGMYGFPYTLKGIVYQEEVIT